MCITHSKHPSSYSAVDCLVGGELLVLVLHFYLGYKAAFTGSHLIFRNVLMLVVPYKARYICALGSEDVHSVCQRREDGTYLQLLCLGSPTGNWSYGRN